MIVHAVKPADKPRGPLKQDGAQRKGGKGEKRLSTMFAISTTSVRISPCIFDVFTQKQHFEFLIIFFETQIPNGEHWPLGLHRPMQPNGRSTAKANTPLGKEDPGSTQPLEAALRVRDTSSPPQTLTVSEP